MGNLFIWNQPAFVARCSTFFKWLKSSGPAASFTGCRPNDMPRKLSTWCAIFSPFTWFSFGKCSGCFSCALITRARMPACKSVAEIPAIFLGNSSSRINGIIFASYASIKVFVTTSAFTNFPFKSLLQNTLPKRLGLLQALGYSFFYFFANT